MVDSISNYLNQSGFNAKGLHAGLTDVEKITIQNQFMSSHTRLLVCTSIFAMGIDKPDVRAVIHVNLPKTMESYLQEIGRAGRDGLPAHCHLFLSESDFHKERSFIIADTPNVQTVERLYNSMLRKSQVKAVSQISEKRPKDKDTPQLKSTDDHHAQILYLDSKYTEESLDTRKDNIYTQLRLIEQVPYTLSTLRHPREKSRSTRSVPKRQCSSSSGTRRRR